MFGPLGILLREAVCGVDDVLNKIYRKTKENYKKRKSGFLQCTETALQFTGPAVIFTDLDESQCSKSFLSAQLHQFYPIWVIGRGVCVIIGT
jgi:hypothetical protein